MSQNTISTLKNYTDRGYTDQEQLDNLSLVDLNGRVYDPTVGRFISSDPFVSDWQYSQSFDRYSYVYNSVLSATDPSGFDAAQLGTAYVNGWFAAASNGIQTISIADLRALLQFQPGPEPLGGGSPDGGGASGQQNTKQKHKACQSESGARSNSTTPTPVTDANGNPVMGTNSNGSQSPMQAPAGLPLSVYEAAGHEVADLNAIAVYGLSMPAAIAANGVNAYNLVNMRDGGSL